MARSIKDTSCTVHRRGLLRAVFVLSLLPAGGMALLYPAQAKAQEPDCEAGSFFCDETWHGGRMFYDLIESWGYERDYHADSSDFGADAARTDVHVWISPRSVGTQVIAQALASGARIVVFDESDVSLTWYRTLVNPSAMVMPSYHTEYAARINGNPDLPVFYVDPAVRQVFDIKSPNDDTTWMVAMNHPVPIIESDAKGNLRGVFYYTLPYSDDQAASEDASIVVVRDADMPMRLMMETLDNQMLVQALLRDRCGDAPHCRVHVYEPGVAFAAAVTGELAETPWYRRVADTVFSSESVSRLRRVWQDESLMSRINWRLFVLAILVAWLVLAIVLALPLKRNKT
jgi:hypothetical protein